MERRARSNNLIIVGTALLLFVIAVSLDMHPEQLFGKTPEGTCIHLVILVVGATATFLPVVLLAWSISWIKSRIVGRLRAGTAVNTGNWPLQYVLFELAALAVVVFVGVWIESHAKALIQPVAILLFWLALLIPINGWVLKSTSIIGDREPALCKRFSWIVGFSMITASVPVAIIVGFWLLKAFLDSFV
jgi:hypothetical protein